MATSFLLNNAVKVSLCCAFLFGLPAILKLYWPLILEFYGGPRNIFAYGTFSVHMIQLILGNCGLWVLYYNRWPVVERFKINKHKPWPWLSENKEERDRFWSTFYYSVVMVLFNNVVVGLASSFQTYDRGATIGAFSASLEDWPSTFTIVWQVLVCAIVEDTMFYFTHRFLHWKPLYPYIHKWHHSYYHSIGIASENANPIEFLLGNLIPVVAGPLLLRSHVITFWMWLMTRISETIDAHSGYAFPWSPARLLPLANPAAAHDYHHSHNRGCFGSQFTFWDALFGTDADFVAFEAKVSLESSGGKPTKLTAAASPSAEEAINGTFDPLAEHAAPPPKSGSSSESSSRNKSE